MPYVDIDIIIIHFLIFNFLKVPLKDDPNFASVNVRELIMLTKVLPQLQEYLDTECDGFFRLPMPEVVHCYYDGNGLFLLPVPLILKYEEEKYF